MRGWAIVGLALCAVAGCDEEPARFTEPVVVDGERIAPETLRKGEFQYMRWCAGCHGRTGRGDGSRARHADRPPPDFTAGEWRHVEVPEGELPPDAHFRRVVSEGIDGTIMEPMRVPENDLDAIVAYVKYLATRSPE